MAARRRVAVSMMIGIMFFLYLSFDHYKYTLALSRLTTRTKQGNLSSQGQGCVNAVVTKILTSIETYEPEGRLWRHTDLDYNVDSDSSARLNATLLSIVRNEELDGMLSSMLELEKSWNDKFNYPWTFFNNVPFSEEFIRRTQEVTKAVCTYHVIPEEHWEVPWGIDLEQYESSAKLLQQKNVRYADKLSYNQMCRWNSGMFYRHTALQHTQYYWRVEPGVRFYCKVDYDVFRYMQDRNKTYGFTIVLYDDPESIPSLWPETLKFLAKYPHHLHQNNALAWLTDNQRRADHNIRAHGYSTCHFWSNFEIVAMSFWRSEAYNDYFTHLDQSGGFFYERWGDAPVHSIALGLFEDVKKIHWFKDIGYEHDPYQNCPGSPKCRNCIPGKFHKGSAWLSRLPREDCRPMWLEYFGGG